MKKYQDVSGSLYFQDKGISTTVNRLKALKCSICTKQYNKQYKLLT